MGDDALAADSQPREFFPANSIRESAPQGEMIDIDAEISGEPRDTAPHGEVIDLDEIQRASEGVPDHLSEFSAAPAPKAEKPIQRASQAVPERFPAVVPAPKAKKPKKRVPVWERLYGLRNTTRRPRGERTFYEQGDDE